MRLFSALQGAALGAGAAYLFDPELGQQRRERLRDQMNEAVDSLVEGLTAAARDFLPQGAESDTKKASQGERGKSRPGEDLTPESWSPATRMAVATVGGTLLTYGATKRFPIACVLGTVGLALVSRATCNTETTQEGQQADGKRTAGNREGQESRERKPAKVN